MIKVSKSTLSMQISILVSFCLMLGVVVYGAVQVQGQSRNATIHKEREVEAIARNIATSSLHMILDENFAAIENLLLNSTEFPDVQNLIIIDEDGSIISEVHDDGKTFLPTFRLDTLSPPVKATDFVRLSEDSISAWSPIVLGGHIKGWVQVKSSLAFLKGMQRTIWKETAIAGFSIFVVGFFMVQIFLRKRMQSLEYASGFARRLYNSRGEHIGESLGVKELDELAVSLNWVSDKLREQDVGLKNRTLQLEGANADLKERVKELNCIYTMTRILHGPIRNVGEQIRSVADMIPPSWHYPELACARIVYMDKEYSSREFRVSSHSLKQDIEVDGVLVGSVEVCYRQKPDGVEDEIFLPEEEHLIEEIASRMSVFFKRYETEIALQDAYQNLEERVRLRTFELEQAKQGAEKANRAKTDFLSRMSHELRTPMNAVLGFAELIKMEDRDEKLSSDQRDFIEEILKAGRHLLELINEVLDLSKVETETMSLSMEAVNIQEMIETVHGMMEPVAREYKIILRKKEECGNVFVFADKLKLKQVIINLVSNGIKYNKIGGFVSIGIGDSDANSVCLEVTDTGVGIADESRDTIFLPFERLGNHDVVDGTGIGLTVTKSLVELMGGSISVTSELEQGSTFKVNLRTMRVGQLN